MRWWLFAQKYVINTHLCEWSFPKIVILGHKLFLFSFNKTFNCSNFGTAITNTLYTLWSTKYQLFTLLILTGYNLGTKFGPWILTKLFVPIIASPVMRAVSVYSFDLWSASLFFLDCLILFPLRWQLCRDTSNFFLDRLREWYKFSSLSELYFLHTKTHIFLLLQA